MARKQFREPARLLSIQMPGVIASGFMREVPGGASERHDPALLTADVRGTRLHYVDFGRGAPVVLVHGSLGDYRTWGYQFEDFAQQFRVVSYSRRFHFPNVWPDSGGEYDLQDHARDLASFIESIGAGPAHLVGQSHGAMIALIVARARPDLVRTLTLCEPFGAMWMSEIDGGTQFLERFMAETWLPAAEAANAGDDLTCARIFIDGVLPGWWGRLTAEMIQVFLDNATATRAELNSSRPPPDFPLSALRAVRAPTLLIEGTDSLPVFGWIAEKVAENLRDVARARAVGSPHAAHFATPRAFNGLVVDYIRRH